MEKVSGTNSAILNHDSWHHVFFPPLFFPWTHFLPGVGVSSHFKIEGVVIRTGNQVNDTVPRLIPRNISFGNGLGCLLLDIFLIGCRTQFRQWSSGGHLAKNHAETDH